MLAPQPTASRRCASSSYTLVPETRLLENAGLPIEGPRMDLARWLTLLGRDKKVDRGHLLGPGGRLGVERVVADVQAGVDREVVLRAVDAGCPGQGERQLEVGDRGIALGNVHVGRAVVPERAFAHDQVAWLDPRLGGRPCCRRE
jgi:hypothetical protein